MELLTLSGAWIWDKYGKEIVDKAVEKAKKQWVSFNWPRAANTYRERMGKLHGTVRVLGKAEPTTLEEVFTDVFILDQPVAFQRHNIEQLEANPDAPQTKRTSGLKAIGNTKNHKLFILGKPGAGKTTFLKHLVLLTVQGKVKKIPIFVPLMEWSDSQLDVMTFIVQQFDLCHFPEAQLFIETMLKRGDAILLFDGLDEVSQRNEHYSQVITELNNFCKKYLDNPCLITCRNAATNYQFEQFTYVEVADFNDQQQQIFVKKWFEDNSLKRDRFLEEIGRPENRGLKELARTPLLLNMLCLAFGETIAFPARRVEIYEEALDALLKKWDASRNIRRNEAYNKLTLGRKKQLFAELAITSFAQDEYFIHQNVLQDQIVTYLEKLPPADGQSDLDGEAILKTIEAQHGILVERAQHIYSFAHLTFQEYFTARYIVDNATSGTFNQLIETWLTNSNWHDVFLLTASMLHNADDLLKLFKEGVDRLAAKDKHLVALLNLVEHYFNDAFSTVPDRTDARAYALYSIIDSGTADILTRAQGQEREFDRALDFSRAQELSRLRNISLSLIRTLTQTPTPTQSDERGHDYPLALAIRSLERSDLNILKHYLEANILFVKCLELAYVSNRKTIKDSLLLPPDLEKE